MFGFEAFDFNLPSSGGQMRVEKVQPPPPKFLKIQALVLALVLALCFLLK